MYYSSGFAIRKKLNSLNNGDYIVDTKIVKDFSTFEEDDVYLKFLPYEKDVEILFSSLKKKYDISNIFLCGRLYDGNDFCRNIEYAFRRLLFFNDYSCFKDVEGNYIIVIETKEKMWIYNSQCSDYVAYWFYDNNQFNISNYHSFVSENIDNTMLTLLCYGDKTNIFKNSNVLKRNSILILNLKNKHCSIIQNAIKPEQLLLKNESMQEIGEIIYYELLNSTKQKLKGYDKVSLLLSGGIDSASIARCLADINANFICYTWGSKNKKVSEYRYSKEIGKVLDIDVLEIEFDESPNNYIFPKSAKVYPFEHTLSNWVFTSFEEAFNFGSKAMFTGLYVSPFQFDSKTKTITLPYKLYSIINTTFPNFILNTNSRNKGVDLLGRDSTIFTEEAKQIIKNHNRIPGLFNKVPTDMYSYKVNCCDKFNIPYESPFLSKKLIDIAHSLPSNYKNIIHGNYMINKVALRYSMLNRLPQSVVSHCCPANLNYVFGYNIQRKYDEILDYFEESSYLVKNNIIDLKKLKSIRNDRDTIFKASSAIQIVCSVQFWIDNYYVLKDKQN